MRIDRISIKNFRKFEDIQISLKSNMNVIAGNNGSGKSTILDALSIGVGSFFLGISRIPKSRRMLIHRWITEIS